MITNVAAQVLDDKGRPQSAGRVEIWQVNDYGRYHHARDDIDKPIDPNFRDYGTMITGAGGVYRFRRTGALPAAYRQARLGL
jgi:protocatechuate 3,4-dioxygenase, beta subunit